MATAYLTAAIYWRLPSGTSTLLEVPDGMTATIGTPNVSDSVSHSITDDGHVIVGSVSDGTVTQSVKWVDGVLGYLTPFVFEGSTVTPGQVSADAGVIVSYFPFGYWSGGGTTTHLLQPLADGVIAKPPQGDRWLSSDGHIIAGQSYASQPTFWTDGVATSLGNPRFLYASPINAISADGSTIIGDASFGQWGDPAFWRTADHSFYKLINSTSSTYLKQVNHDGTIIYGQQLSDSGYWDNLTTRTGGTVSDGYYGTFHTITYVGAGTGSNLSIAKWADDANISCGSMYLSSQYRSVKAIASAANVLPMRVGDVSSSVTGISGDGSIICGMVNDATYVSSPCYWDSGGTLHMLTIPAGWANTPGAASYVYGVSRDGSTIFGSISKSITVPDPPPPPDPELKLVSLYTSSLPESSYSFINTNFDDFDETFGQFSVSAWVCETATLRWPDTGTPFGLLTMTQSQVYAEFRTAAGVLLFSGTFINPNGPSKLFQIKFSIDTQAQTCMCYGDNTQWTSTDAVFAAVGDIGNLTWP